MSTRRLDKWNEQRRFPFLILGRDVDVWELARKKSKLDERISDTVRRGVTGYAKEIIFDIEDGQPVFYFVVFALDSESFTLQLAPVLKQVNLESDDEVKRTLLEARVDDVPVYPNTNEVAQILARYERDLLLDGVELVDPSGQSGRYHLTNSPGPQIDTVNHIRNLSFTEMHTPAELFLVRDVILQELTRLDEASRMLASLRLAIDELTEGLASPGRNENLLQACLTRNPILFGPEYTRTLPKHRLGSDFVTDYALERVSGLVDLIEIEASNHRLFTSKGHPTSHLVVAEQQILDWLEWVETNSAYARDKLPGLQQPLGYVVIGRSTTLSPSDQQRLQWRNIIFRGRVQIMTYDDVVLRAENLLKVLEGRILQRASVTVAHESL
jgi:hypothetical protein